MWRGRAFCVQLGLKGFSVSILSVRKRFSLSL
jgi:hypothetical protein